ncbi:MAG: LysM peptidoglycan-binding domain-containing protein [Bacteroidota bacterium]
MKKQIILAIFILTGIVAFANPQDSIGMKTVGGKQYIMHKVAKGEGVYSISKKYGVSASDVYTANAGSDKGIKIDQVLLIPSSSKNISGSGGGAGVSASSTTSVKKVEKKYHVVAAGQTLSSLAKKFNTTVTDIKKWNNLKSDNINLGQKLVVGETVTTTQQTTPQQTTKKETEKPVLIEEEEIAVVDDVKQTDNSANQKTETKSTDNVVVDTDNQTKAAPTKAYVVEDGDEVTESGTGVVSTEGELGQDRSFVLHPTAKVGTIIMITNPDNNNAVFARVVGSCKASNGTILYMSKTVADKLGVNGDSKLTINYAR